ncbi:MAG: ABC transporter ATP-binding protein [Chloroflexi bacterium]|nr:ABC transporter ATP-binding protein [Chloroflexota bacterium]
MGFFSNLDVEAYDRQYSDRELLKRIIGYFRPHGRRMVQIGFFLFLISLLGAAIPLFLSRSLDLIGQQISPEVMLAFAGGVFLLGFLIWVANWVSRRLMAMAIGDVVLAIRLDGFRAASAHDLSFYDEFSSGKVVSRITSDTREFGNVVQLVADLMSQLLLAVILGIGIVAVNVRLSLYLFAFMPLVFFVALGFRRIARRVTRRGMRAMGNVNAAIKETVSGISVAKNFRQEESIFDEFDEANQSSFQVNLRRGLVLSMVFPTLNALAAFGTGMLLYVGGLAAADALITAGAWYLFFESLNRFWFPMLNLSAFWTQLQSGLSAAERAFALVDAESKVNQVGAYQVEQLKGEIVFKDVDFRYTDQETVLRDFNLQVRAGENVALVGHTGAGKSSIAKLVARFYEFQDGLITVDGRDIRELDLTDYRRQLGIVSQTPFLFSASIAENIRYARPEATDEEIETLARRIGDGSWLETLPQGLATEVGERGGRLSMGQRQLVSLLRVLVQRPAIFVLDEATASIDPFTEWQIQQALGLILKEATSILIAHRLSTIKASDRIIVLENGQIIEEGDHDGLLAKEGNYANLYNTYFRHQSLAYVEQARELAGKAGG